MLNIYLGCTTFIFGFLWFIWSTSSWLNTTIKMGLFSMTGFSIFMLLQSLGYIVKL